ncbi:TylF/MycF/NovP-related O-methyltransferase [Halorussus amylolyticus]|uniref:TylF/MycF/NovP-related O-methyltransferase n=1 Tax=Halorussus amylolyticus TaxID=1126242 RepID=UPI00138F55FF|nr:TylF/MycF/NovP-related O-methyltransferase [Halorussus amylolyticus]
MGAVQNAVGTFQRLYRIALVGLCSPVILAEYFRPETGSEYGVGLTDKLVLAAKMLRNNRRISTGSTFLEHLVMATKILNVPADIDGGIVECGCYKGGSTANLSLVAGLCGRRLDVFDSFEGMPEPTAGDEAHTLVASEQVHTYEAGSWRATLREARGNVSKYGDASACHFHVGYFEETLPAFDRPCVVAFLDVGLRDSAETCLANLWPQLADGGYLFTHEAKHMEIASLFFDAEWWRANLDREPPGLVGAGSGLGLHPGPNGFTSLLAYVVKNPDAREFDVVSETGEGNNCIDVSLVGNE